MISTLSISKSNNLSVHLDICMRTHAIKNDTNTINITKAEETIILWSFEKIPTIL
jgi:hypothetical protein